MPQSVAPTPRGLPAPARSAWRAGAGGRGGPPGYIPTAQEGGGPCTPKTERISGVPARAVVHAARVEAQAGDDHVGVAGVRVDRDPLARAGLAPGHEAARVERGLQQSRRRAARRRPSPSSRSRVSSQLPWPPPYLYGRSRIPLPPAMIALTAGGRRGGRHGRAVGPDRRLVAGRRAARAAVAGTTRRSTGSGACTAPSTAARSAAASAQADAAVDAAPAAPLPRAARAARCPRRTRRPPCAQPELA